MPAGPRAAARAARRAPPESSCEVVGLGEQLLLAAGRPGRSIALGQAAAATLEKLLPPLTDRRLAVPVTTGRLDLRALPSQHRQHNLELNIDRMHDRTRHAGLLVDGAPDGHVP